MSRWIALVALAMGLTMALKVAQAAFQPTKPTRETLKPPPNWNPSDPLPLEATNCARCHLKAGRELTVPVRDFARSVHDRAHLSCNDCHGGNTGDDSTAHEPEHDFIGTKLSAHMKACSECHSRQAQWFRKGKHFWDLSKSINRKYPVCIDCHGNHDVGRPPAEFSLMNVCTDCHKTFAADMPALASVVAENDRLWQVLRKVHAKSRNVEQPTPKELVDDLAAVRAKTCRVMHHAVPISGEESKSLNDQVKQLRERLESWLKTNG